MKDKKVKTLVTIPASLLKQIDQLAKQTKTDRSSFICASLQSKFFADECRKADYVEAAKANKQTR